MSRHPPIHQSPIYDDDVPWVRLACALLYAGLVGARAGDADDVEWVASDDARLLALRLSLPNWPPSAAQLARLPKRPSRAPQLL